MTLKHINRRRTSLLRAVFQPGANTADRFDFEFDGKELAALGYAVVSWAFLEEGPN